MVFSFQFIFTAFLSVLLAILRWVKMECIFVDKLPIRFYSLHRFDTWLFCDGGCYVVEPFIFFTVSMIMWPILIYNLPAFAILLYILFLHQVLRVRLSCADLI